MDLHDVLVFGGHVFRVVSPRMVLARKAVAKRERPCSQRFDTQLSTPSLNRVTKDFEIHTWTGQEQPASTAED